MRRVSTVIKKMEEEFEEYHYPKHPCSAILLPDGRMFGMPGILKHREIISQITGGDKDSDNLLEIWLIKMKLVTISVGKKGTLWITAAAFPSSKQKEVLNDLIDYGNYYDVEFTQYDGRLDGMPTTDDMFKIFPNHLHMSKFRERKNRAL